MLAPSAYLVQRLVYRLLTGVHLDDIIRPVGSRPNAVFCKTESAKEWRCEQVDCPSVATSAHSAWTAKGIDRATPVVNAYQGKRPLGGQRKTSPRRQTRQEWRQSQPCRLRAKTIFQLAFATVPRCKLGLGGVTFHATTTGGLEIQPTSVIHDSLAHETNRRRGLPTHFDDSATKTHGEITA